MSQIIIHNVRTPRNCLAPSRSENSPMPNVGSGQDIFCSATIVCQGSQIASVEVASQHDPPEIAPIAKPTSNSTTVSLDGAGYTALPGFIDIHVHGGMGADTMDGTSEALQTMAQFFVQHGVTSFCPTTMTAPHADIRAAVEAVRAECARAENITADNGQVSNGARILGCHVEGPYISPKYPGAQPAGYVRQPNLDEFCELIESGPIRLITVAPEEPNAHELIAKALEHEVVVVIGHTNATYEECVIAAELGATQATHTYNAMTGLHHRNPGTVGAVMTNESLDAQLIADNIHVHPAAMQVLYKCKGEDGIILITDAMRAAGLADGQYSLGGQDVTVKNGECRLADGTLAGSVLTEDQALRNFIAATDAPLSKAWPATSRNAARSLGLDDKLGSIAPGYWADIVLLDQELRVAATIVSGQVAYNNGVPLL